MRFVDDGDSSPEPPDPAPASIRTSAGFASVSTSSARSTVSAALVAHAGTVSLTLALSDAHDAELTVSLLVLDEDPPRIVLGSDVLAARAADVLFSQNRLVLRADDGRRVSVPFSRPPTPPPVRGQCARACI